VIEVAREALEAIYAPAFYSRVGLRYKNIIDKEKIGLSEESWHGLLKSPLIGILGAEELASDLVGIQTHSLIKIDEVPGGFVTLRHGLRETKPRETKVYTVDVDFFTEERSKGADVSKILDRFNRLTGNFFRWAITKKLHNALDPEELPSLE
jgi:uncharacterized protein (TIGR04255 family)